MKPDTTKTLIKELEQIKTLQSKNSYTVAWYILIITIFSLVIYLAPLDKFISGSKLSMFSSILILICLLILLFQSLFVIIRYTVDKRIRILFEAFLDSDTQ
jgi:Zn-dependent protease with chaperone function